MLTQFKGGSNYLACGPNIGVVHEFHNQKQLIQFQLALMAAQGQKMLRLPLTYLDGADGGVNLNSANGEFPAQVMDNLQGLLVEMKAAGFERAIISLHPQWNNSPVAPRLPLWQTFGEAERNYFETAWSLCCKLHDIVIKESPIPIWVDLCNEALPLPDWQPAIWTYCKLLFRHWVVDSGWSDGLATTVGFSAEKAANLASMREIYTIDGKLYQPAFQDIHIYGDRNRTAYEAFMDAHAVAPNVPFIIGETYGNDMHCACDLADAIPESGHSVAAVLQWPVAYDDSEVICPDFSVYAAKGF